MGLVKFALERTAGGGVDGRHEMGGGKRNRVEYLCKVEAKFKIFLGCVTGTHVHI